jgi:hypothetical protein
MDDTGAPVVKIDARWSPQNVYVIDGKALSLDGFVKHSTGPREMLLRLGERTPADTAKRGWML